MPSDMNTETPAIPKLLIPLSLTPSEISCLMTLLERGIENAAPFARARLKSVYQKLDAALFVDAPPSSAGVNKLP